MEIRLAEKKDIEGILALQTQIYRVDKLSENARILLSKMIESKDLDVLVAKDNGKVVASVFIFYLPVPAHGKPYAFFEGMIVDKDSRGKGIGTKLTQKAVTLAKKRGCYKILFTSGFDRESIHKFYENLGFKKWGFEFRLDL